MDVSGRGLRFYVWFRYTVASELCDIFWIFEYGGQLGVGTNKVRVGKIIHVQTKVWNLSGF